MDEKQVNARKPWASAYAVRNHPRIGPFMHGAGMVEQTTGVTHFWLVRGPCTQSVVRELQSQLTFTYCRPKPPAATSTVALDRANDRLLAAIVLAGICGAAVGTLVGK